MGSRLLAGHEIGDLPDKIDNQHQAVQKLEKALFKYLKQDKLGDRRPTTRPGAWWKLWEKKVDAIDLWTEKVRESEDDIKEERKRSGKVESYGTSLSHLSRSQVTDWQVRTGFVSFPSAAQAQDVTAKLKGTHPSAGGVKILNAPDPRDIIWSNVGRSRGEVAGMRIAFSFLLALVVFWCVLCSNRSSCETDGTYRLQVHDPRRSGFGRCQSRQFLVLHALTRPGLISPPTFAHRPLCRSTSAS